MDVFGWPSVGLGVKAMCLESEGSNGCAWVASGGGLGGQRDMLGWPPAGVGESKGCVWSLRVQMDVLGGKGMCLESEGSNGCAWVASGGGSGGKGMCLGFGGFKWMCLGGLRRGVGGSKGYAWVASGGGMWGQRDMLGWPPAGV